MQQPLGFQAWWLLTSGVWWPTGPVADTEESARGALYARLRGGDVSIDVDTRAAVLPTGERPDGAPVSTTDEGQLDVAYDLCDICGGQLDDSDAGPFHTACLNAIPTLGDIDF